MSPISASPLPSVRHELKAALCADLHPSDSQTLLDNLLGFTDVFDEGLGHSSVLQHTIGIGDSASIRQYLRRLPYVYRIETKFQRQDMLKQGVIQPRYNPWASPIVVVKKKAVSFGFYVGYWKFNSATKKIPNLSLGWMIRLTPFKDHVYSGLHSGYWQINVDPRDREKLFL